MSSLKGSTVQLECPETVPESRELSWYFKSGSGVMRMVYSINSQINPGLQSQLHMRINITGNHTIGEYHLSIYELEESDAGIYECDITGTAIAYRQQLTVIGKSTFIAIQVTL